MITLLTGVPGSGKTLNMIKLGLELQKSGDDRQIYFNHIDGLNIQSWVELTDDEVRGWQSLPRGALVLIDEAHKVFPQRTRGAAPSYISALDEHRHNGFDFLLTTQHPKKLDVEVRRLCGKHLHYDRKFGSKLLKEYRWETAQDNPTDYHAKQESVSKAVVLDKSIFGLYHSAEIHTAKFALPFKLVLVILFLILVVPSVLYLVFSSFSGLDLNAGALTTRNDDPGLLISGVQTNNHRAVLDPLQKFGLASPGSSFRVVSVSSFRFGLADFVLTVDGLVFTSATLVSLGYLLIPIGSDGGLMVKHPSGVQYFAPFVAVSDYYHDDDLDYSSDSLSTR